MAREMKDSGVEWIGQIPKDWKVLPAQYGFSEVKRKNTDGAIQKALQFKFGSIIPKSNFDADSDDYVAGTITTYTIVEPGTVMINGLNLNYDFKTQRTALVKETGVITSAYLALWPDRSMITPEYATYLFKGYETRMALHNMGAGLRLTLGFREFKKQPVLFPSLEEQQRIADFLDAKCALINTVVEQTRASVEEYKKLKQSMITEAVTKGIRPGRKMKDSGIQWIGEIPEDWSILKLHYLCEMQAGKNITSESIAPEGKFPVYGGNGLRGYYEEYNTEGDFLLVGRQGALCGNVHRVSGRFWATEHAVITTPSTLSDIGFLYYLLVGMNLNQYVNNTAAQPGLAVSQIQRVRTCLVPLEEQREIAQYLDEKCGAIDVLLEQKTRLITELESYKKSLIYEYVTGKKEVPAAE